MNKTNDEFFNRGEPYAAVFLGSPYTVQKTFDFEIECLNRSQLLMTDAIDKGIFAVINF